MTISFRLLWTWINAVAGHSFIAPDPDLGVVLDDIAMWMLPRILEHGHALLFSQLVAIWVFSHKCPPSISQIHFLPLFLVTDAGDG